MRGRHGGDVQLDPVWDGHAHASEVVVVAKASKLGVLAVEVKPAVGIPTQRADAYGRHEENRVNMGARFKSTSVRTPGNVNHK